MIISVPVQTATPSVRGVGALTVLIGVYTLATGSKLPPSLNSVVMIASGS